MSLLDWLTAAIPFGFFVALGLEWWLERKLKRTEVFPYVKFWMGIGIGFFLIVGILNGVIPELLPMQWILDHSLLPGQSLGLLWGAFVGFLLTTFVDYWIHRLEHRSDFIWRWFHQLHHSAERVDLAGFVYTHPFETIVVIILLESVVVNTWILGVSMEAAAIVGMSMAFTAMFQHMNISTPVWIGYIFQRPEAHRVHHQRDLHAYNYSSFPLWDIIFGTFRLADEKDTAPVVGFDPKLPKSLLSMLLGKDVYKSSPVDYSQKGQYGRVLD